MLKLLVVLALCLSVCAGEEATLESCKCGEGYQPEKSSAGKVECVGVLLDHTKACNIPESPKCTCTGEISGILTDGEGTWCQAIKNGEKKRWACENKEEWDKYKVKLAEYEKSLKH